MAREYHGTHAGLSNADFVDLIRLAEYVQDMVKMSPLQGRFFEVVPSSHGLALIGSAVSARIR